MSTVPGASSATSSAVGLPTRTTASRSGEELAARDDSAPAAAYSASGKPRQCACALLDCDREAGAHEPPDRVGDERYPALAGFGLFRDDDPHGDATLR